VVNDGSGTPEEAARWVAYCNDPQSTEQGQRRATNGHQSPYNVKYWGIGNEVWGPWQIGTTSAKEYSGRLKRFTQAMKAIDPSIKIIAVGNNPLSDSLDDSAAKWNKEVLNDASEEIDFLSWHIYQPEQDSWKESYDPLSLFASVCAAPLDIDAIIQRVGKEIDNSKGSGRITQCIDEWNIWLPPGKQARSMHQVTYTMRDALYIAGVINVFFRNFKQVDIGNLAQLVNVLPLIQTNQTSATATAIYYPFELAAELEENVLAITTNSPMFNSQAIGVNVQFHTNVPYLDAVATQDEEGDSLTFLLTNRHPENRMNVNIQLPAGLVFSSIITKEIKAASPLSFNSFSHPYAVRIHSHDSISISGNNYQVKMSPASIMLIRLEK
jgi:alpha-N-arabinofuranosidase